LEISSTFCNIKINRNKDDKKSRQGMRKYLNSLIRKHRKLDKQISQARWDENQLRAMKKLRLTLKDSISQLQKGAMRRSV
jgi:uncharacterized protein YdcH (DUF465 family)